MLGVTFSSQTYCLVYYCLCPNTLGWLQTQIISSDKICRKFSTMSGVWAFLRAMTLPPASLSYINSHNGKYMASKQSHMYMHTNTNRNKQSCACTNIHYLTWTHAHTCTHTHTHTHAHTCTHTHTHTCTHLYTHTCTHAHTLTHTNTHVRTHTHTHT